jgi:CheY-like chemotaxis protein
MKKTGHERFHRVLVVDDDEVVREVASAVLRRSGVEVIPARDGRQALEVLRQRKETPHLVLTDLCMPDVDGWMLLDAMREDEDLRAVPVIVLTSSGSVEYLPVGVPVLHKPIDTELLAAMVHGMLPLLPPEDADRPSAARLLATVVERLSLESFRRARRTDGTNSRER